MRVLLGVVLLSTLWFMFAPYQPAVIGADGRQVITVTEPVLPLRGLKRAQAQGELKPCRYSLLGWQDAALFYQADCGGEATVWRFQPLAMDGPIQHEGESMVALASKRVSPRDVLDLFRNASTVYPAEAEPSVRSLKLDGDVMFSPDGTWLAVVAQHIYGAEDVLLTTGQFE